MTEPRTAALLAGIGLLALAVAVAALSTPWRPIPREVSGHSATTQAGHDFTEAERQRARAYHRRVRPPAYASSFVTLLLTLLLALTPLGADLVEAAGGLAGGGWVAEVVLGSLALLLLGRLVSLPFAAVVESVQRRAELSTRSWRGWADDLLRGFAVAAVLGPAALLALVALVRAQPRWWWVTAAVVAALLVVVMSFLVPVVIEPVFNRFTPLADGPLREALLDLARRDRVEIRDVLVADASRRTSTLNAYVSGLGSTRRVVVYDTLVQTVPPEQVEAVVAHELGHAKHRDVATGTLLGAVGAAATVCLLAAALTPTLLDRAGASSAADPRAIPLMLGILAVLGALSGPPQLLVSRRIEARADVHALGLTRDATTFVRMQRSLAVEALADVDPHPIRQALVGSHPSTTQRIALARRWARATGTVPPGDLAPVAGSAG